MRIKVPNKVYLTPSPAFLNLSPASQQTIKDTIKFSSEIGFEPIFIKNRRENIVLLNPTFYGKLLQAKSANVILATYPYICRPTKDHLFRDIESRLLKNLLRDKISILYMIDLPIEQSIAAGKEENIDRKAYEIERRILESFDVLLVFNKNMKKIVQERYDIEDEKFIQFEILDYGIDFTPQRKKAFSEDEILIVYAGNLKKEYVGDLSNLPQSHNIKYEFFGKEGGWISRICRKDFIYKGYLPPSELVSYISKYSHFGIFLYNKNFTRYLQTGSTSKFSAYMVAGLPVLSPSRCSYISYLVNKYKVGLTFDSFDDIPKLLHNLGEEDYERLRRNCIKLGEKIKKGYFFKKAIRKAMEVLY